MITPKFCLNTSLLFFLFSISFYSCKNELNLPLLNQVEKRSLHRKADSLHRIGLDHYRTDNYRSAILPYKEAIKLRQTVLENHNNLLDTLKTLNDSILEGQIKSFNNLGMAYYKMNDYENAELYLNKCDSIQKKYFEVFGFKTIKRRRMVSGNLGLTFKNSKGLKESQKKFEEAIDYSIAENSKREIAKYNNHISWLNIVWRESKLALRHAKEAFSIYEEIDDISGKAKSLVNIGASYELADDYNLALYYYDSASFYLNKDFDFNSEFIANVFHNKAAIYLKSNEIEPAHSAIDSSIYINYNRNSEIDLADNYSVKADIFLAEEKYDSSFNYYQRAVSLFNRFQSVTTAKIGQLEALEGQAQSLVGLGKKTEALEIFEKTSNSIYKTRKDFRDNESKIRLAGIAKKIYEGAIDLSLQLGDKNKTFHFMEDSKAFTLLEGIRHYKAVEIAGVPQDLLKRENELRVAISHLIQKADGESDTNEKIKLSDEQGILQKELDAINTELRKNKKYQQFMLETPLLSATDIRNDLLKKDQALVEYFVGEEKIYAAIIAKPNVFEIVTIDLNNAHLSKLVNGLLDGISKQTNNSDKPIARTISQATPYEDYSHKLYQKLIVPLIPHLKGMDRLIFIPDGELNNLPFEALLQEATASSVEEWNRKYLGKDYTISYCYSATLLKEMRTAKVREKRKILAFAPEFKEGNQFQPLIFSKIEVENIKKIFGRDCQAIIGPDASLEKFNQAIQDKAYGILHLSTHGYADDNNPGDSHISFSQSNTIVDKSQLLYVRDLYNMRLPYDLIVLSACETNKGMLRKGEGIMTFTRGLSFAGAKSIVSTLWQVNQQYSEELMVAFYEYLNEGFDKDEALAKAKRDLMDEGPNRWAAFISIGAM